MDDWGWVGGRGQEWKAFICLRTSWNHIENFQKFLLFQYVRDAHIIGVLMFLFLFLFHWKLETTDFGHFCCFQILDDVINAECKTSRGYAARLHLGYDLIVISLVCYMGWMGEGGRG